MQVYNKQKNFYQMLNLSEQCTNEEICKKVYELLVQRQKEQPNDLVFTYTLKNNTRIVIDLTKSNFVLSNLLEISNINMNISNQDIHDSFHIVFSRNMILRNYHYSNDFISTLKNYLNYCWLDADVWHSKDSQYTFDNKHRSASNQICSVYSLLHEKKYKHYENLKYIAFCLISRNKCLTLNDLKYLKKFLTLDIYSNNMISDIFNEQVMILSYQAQFDMAITLNFMNSLLTLDYGDKMEMWKDLLSGSTLLCKDISKDVFTVYSYWNKETIDELVLKTNRYVLLQKLSE